MSLFLQQLRQQAGARKIPILGPPRRQMHAAAADRRWNHFPLNKLIFKNEVSF
jgi:hypothetical protein